MELEELIGIINTILTLQSQYIILTTYYILIIYNLLYTYYIQLAGRPGVAHWAKARAYE